MFEIHRTLRLEAFECRATVLPADHMLATAARGSAGLPKKKRYMVQDVSCKRLLAAQAEETNGPPRMYVCVLA